MVTKFIKSCLQMEFFFSCTQKVFRNYIVPSPSDSILFIFSFVVKDLL